MEIIDGKHCSETILNTIKEEVKIFKTKPQIALIRVEGDIASEIYVNLKKKKAKEAGICSIVEVLKNDVSEEDLLSIIEKYNKDELTNGILVQLPLPQHINTEKVLDAISPQKDVDGFHKFNIGKIAQNREPLAYPCTPLGIIKLFEFYNIDIEGKNITIVGRSNIVGKPLGLMLLNKNATVTFAHSKTKNLKDVTLNADIIVSATGCPNLIKADMVKEKAVVIDVGIIKYDDKLKGDVDFSEVSKKASMITPVPGGVGPMTIAMLLFNTLKLYKMQNNLK